jgi:hypothetical protein
MGKEKWLFHSFLLLQIIINSQIHLPTAAGQACFFISSDDFSMHALRMPARQRRGDAARHARQEGLRVRSIPPIWRSSAGCICPPRASCKP